MLHRLMLTLPAAKSRGLGYEACRRPQWKQGKLVTVTVEGNTLNLEADII
jgi:hypothetical protein